jgi:peptidoglycan hydrolase-like protein with peptidoglycan-binding domain
MKILPGNSLKFKKILLRAQLSLNSSGYDIGPMGNGMNAKTVAAIYRFQKDKGMIPSGKLTNEVLSALGISAV